MRFLCLHGKGTNSRVFELQTAALRYELGDGHEYDFVEGSIDCDAAPELDLISSPNESFFAYYDERSVASCREALDDLDAYTCSAGPFDGVIAFSAGGILASTLIVRNAQQHTLPQFGCAIFFCGGGPCDPSALARGEVIPLSYATNGELISIPTAHIWGRNDPRSHTYGPTLSDLCRTQLKSVFVHEGGHEIPGARDRGALSKAVACVRSTVDKIHTLH